jgi:hypothetical protein
MLAYLFCFLLTGPEETSPLPEKPVEKVPPFVIDPLQSKDLAKAKLEATTGTTRELLLAKLEAARREYEGRESESIAGRGTLDILFGASLRLLDSEREVDVSPGEHLAALHRYWSRSKLLEDRQKAWMEAGRVPVKEYYEAKYRRLLAEIWIADAKAKGARPALDARRNLLDVAPVDTKELARAKFSFSRASLKEVNEAKLNAAHIVYFSRSREFLAGRGTLDILLGCSLRLLEAEQAVAQTESERVAALQGHWARTRLFERVNLTRYQAGRITIQDYLQSKYFQLEAELRLSQLRKKEMPLDFASSVRGPFRINRPPDLYPKDLAKAAVEALHIDAEQWAREKLETARGGSNARFREFLAGRGTLDILLEVLIHRLESELALATSQSDRLASYEKHWERTMLIEIINKGRYDRKQIPIQDYMQSKYFRLQAQIWLTEAKAKQSD